MQIYDIFSYLISFDRNLDKKWHIQVKNVSSTSFNLHAFKIVPNKLTINRKCLVNHREDRRLLFRCWNGKDQNSQ